MKRSQITPTTGGLFLLGLSTVLLMGVPDLDGQSPLRGTVSGFVRDASGAPVDDVRIAMFDAATLELREWTSTDEEGSFSLARRLPVYHLYVGSAPEEGLVGRWYLNREPAGFDEYDIALERGHWVDISVRDEENQLVSGAEVRVYSHGSELTACLTRTLTNDDGAAQVLLPEGAHVGVLGKGLGLRSSWSFDVSNHTMELGFTFPRADWIQGRVQSADGTPLDDVVVSSWEEREGTWHWNGYQRTDRFGDFDLVGSKEGTDLRVLDRDQDHLPLELRIAGDELTNLELVLPKGDPLDLQLAGKANPRTTKVRTWVESTGTWGWAVRPDMKGVLSLAVSQRHGVVTETENETNGEELLWDRDLAAEGPTVVLGSD